MPAQSITLGTTNVPLAGLGQYVGQTGSYPLNNTRQGQQKMWMRVDANPATQGQVRNMSSFQGKQLMCVQGTTQSPVGNEIIFAMPKNSSLNCQNATLVGGGGVGAAMPGNPQTLYGQAGAAGIVLQTQPGPGAAYILFNGTCSFLGGGGGGGAAGQSAAGVGLINGGAGGAGGMGIYYNNPGPLIYQGAYTASGGGGGGGGGGTQQTAANQYGGGGGGGAAGGAGGSGGGGAYPGALPFGGVTGTTTGGQGGQSTRVNGQGNGGAGGGPGQAGQGGQGGVYQTSPLVNANGGAGGSAGVALFINGFGTLAPG